MRCIECGTEMRLLDRVQDGTMMVRGYWHHTLECPKCQKIERRLIFDRTKRSLTGRSVQIGHEPANEVAYVAIDTKSGQVVMRHRDSARLQELCEWLGWNVIAGQSAQTMVG